MKSLILLILFFLLLDIVVYSQSTATKINNSAAKVNNTNHSINNASSTLDSTSQAVGNLTKTIGGIFKSKKKNAEATTAQMQPETQAAPAQTQTYTQVAQNVPAENTQSQNSNIITINITGVDYGKLKFTKDSIKTVAGVEAVEMNFSSGMSSLKVHYNGFADALWDAVSSKVTSLYSINNLSDNSITASLIKQ